jgi:hypothetical protein
MSDEEIGTKAGITINEIYKEQYAPLQGNERSASIRYRRSLRW